MLHSCLLSRNDDQLDAWQPAMETNKCLARWRTNTYVSFIFFFTFAPKSRILERHVRRQLTSFRRRLRSSTFLDWRWRAVCGALGGNFSILPLFWLLERLTCVSGGSVRANVGMADALYSAHFCKEKENKFIQMSYAYLLVFNEYKITSNIFIWKKKKTNLLKRENKSE